MMARGGRSRWVAIGSDSSAVVLLLLVHRYNRCAGGADNGFANEDGGLPSSALSFLSIFAPSPSLFFYFWFRSSASLFFFVVFFSIRFYFSPLCHYSSPLFFLYSLLSFFLLLFLCIISLSLSFFFLFFSPCFGFSLLYSFPCFFFSFLLSIFLSFSSPLPSKFSPLPLYTSQYL